MTIKKLTALIGMAIVATGCSTQPISTTTATSTSITPSAPVPNERERMLASLNLTDVQKSQLEALRLQNRPKTQQLQAQIKQFNDRINQQKLVAQTVDNQVNLLGLYQDKHALTLQEQALHLAYEQKFLAILSPAQRLTYYQSLAENKQP